ncbi:MAG: type II toxin-antitoxin system RelE/ParE family toxin [Patescibacteria group bacterium]
MNWNVTIANAAQKELKRIQLQDAQKIMEVIESMSEDPFFGDVKKFSDKTWRWRVGSYRIFYNIHSDIRLVYIFSVERRTSKTY